MNILVIIPARGGSKGIPRKNLRALGGKPLISYSIQMANSSRYELDVYVTSDDAEILSVSRKLGAKTIIRAPKLSNDDSTLDPVVFDAYQQVRRIEKKEYTLIITLQPSSPILKSESFDDAIKSMLTNNQVDTVISATDNTHLTWVKSGKKFCPNYESRVNRQYLPVTFKETGGFLITRPHAISRENRIGERVELYLLSGGEAIDIDTYEDWSLCEYYLKQKKVLFVVSGNKEIGLGHVYNVLLIANDIMKHNVEFLVDSESHLAFEQISSQNYIVHIQEQENIVEDIKRLNPDIVINDILDTKAAYIRSLKLSGKKVVNFEDLGAGAQEADLVINAIYPEKEKFRNHYFGYEYFVLRDEFILSKPKHVSEKVRNVLLTFGGVDANNYTLKVLKSIYDYCIKNDIRLSVVAGFGYQQYSSLATFEGIDVFRDTADISEHMKRANIIFTSAGRTTYEVASLNVPAIVLAQNKRELTHFFAAKENGFVNLGLGTNVSNKEILSAFDGLVRNFTQRKELAGLMSRVDLRSGRGRTQTLIEKIIEEI